MTLLDDLAQAMGSTPDELRTRVLAQPIDLETLPPTQRFLTALALTACGQDALLDVLTYLPEHGRLRHAAVGLRTLVAWPEGVDPLSDTEAAMTWVGQVELHYDGSRWTQGGGIS